MLHRWSDRWCSTSIINSLLSLLQVSFPVNVRVRVSSPLALNVLTWIRDLNESLQTNWSICLAVDRHIRRSGADELWRLLHEILCVCVCVSEWKKWIEYKYNVVFLCKTFKCLCLWYSFWPQEAELHHGPDPSVHTNRFCDITVMIWFWHVKPGGEKTTFILRKNKRNALSHTWKNNHWNVYVFYRISLGFTFIYFFTFPQINNLRNLRNNLDQTWEKGSTGKKRLSLAPQGFRIYLLWCHSFWQFHPNPDKSSVLLLQLLCSVISSGIRHLQSSDQIKAFTWSIINL